MKTRKEIEGRIAELDIIIAEDDRISEENRTLYNEAHRKLATGLMDYLKDAGYPVDEFTTVDVGMMFGNKSVSVSFKNKSRAEFNVTFRDKRIADVSATGISSRGATPEELADMGSYYKMVSLIMEKLNSEYFSTNMSLFFGAIEDFTEPEMKKGVDGIYGLKSERIELEKQIRVLGLELEVGKTVEVYFEGSGRRFRSCWREATIEKLTDKMVYVDCKAYGTKAINRSDVLGKIRNASVAV
jgi:hypothetical protein